MSYRVTHWTGEMEANFPIGRLGDLLDELAVDDAEHPDVAVSFEGRSLSISRSGYATLENVESGLSRHMKPESRESTIELMGALARGDLAEVERHEWHPGYPPT
jgi:hypothetical protein